MSKTNKKKNRNVFCYLKSTLSSYRYVIKKNNAPMKNKLEFYKFDPIMKKKALFKECSFKKKK